MANDRTKVNHSATQCNKKSTDNQKTETGAVCRDNGTASPVSVPEKEPPFSISAHKKTVGREIEQSLSVDLYPDGVRINGLKLLQKQEKKGGGNRGKIAGWSKASRRRMREFLLSYRVPSALKLANITLTIPGPILPIEEQKRIWNHFQVKFRRRGCIGVWRKETQKRGQIHWHMIAGIRSDLKAEDIEKMWFDCLAADSVEYGELQNVATDTECSRVLNRDASCDWVLRGVVQCITSKNKDWVYCLCGLWGREIKVCFDVKSLEELKEIKGQAVEISGQYSVVRGRVVKCVNKIMPARDISETSGLFVRRFPDLSLWRGAYKYAVDVSFEYRSSGSWKRYIQDHATKSKQEQIIEDSGRSWGVIGKDRFILERPRETVFFVSHKAFCRYLRAFGRLRTPQIQEPKSIFGCKLGYPAGGGLFGSRVWFTRGADSTGERLAKWANKTEKEREKNGSGKNDR